MSILKSLRYFQQKPTKPVRRREVFDLGESRVNRVYYFAGDNLSVEDLTAGAVITLRFDQPDATAHTLVIHNSYQLQPFNRIYLTNTIQAAVFLTIEFDYYGFNTAEQANESLQALNEMINDVKLNTLRLLDSGTRINVFAEHNGGSVVLYTVPAGRVFYLLSYDLNGMPLNNAIGIEAALFYGVLNDFAHLDGFAGCLYVHTQNAFSNIRLVAGDAITDWGTANTRVASNIQGVEIHA